MLRVVDFTGHAQEGNRLDITDPKAFLERQFSHPYLPTIAQTGVYKNMGWLYDFRPYLNRYVVEQYGRWQAYYHTSKTGLRRTLDGQRAVTEIVLVKAKSI